MNIIGPDPISSNPPPEQHPTTTEHSNVIGGGGHGVMKDHYKNYEEFKAANPKEAKAFEEGFAYDIYTAIKKSLDKMKEASRKYRDSLRE